MPPSVPDRGAVLGQKPNQLNGDLNKIWREPHLFCPSKFFIDSLTLKVIWNTGHPFCMPNRTDLFHQ